MFLGQIYIVLKQNYMVLGQNHIILNEIQIILEQIHVILKQNQVISAIKLIHAVFLPAADRPPRLAMDFFLVLLYTFSVGIVTFYGLP